MIQTPNPPLAHHLNRARSEKGQISIMIGAMMTTFIIMFVFVINTGMLVNAKINLQNAADLAAYAGAATQARQLTHISWINYEMRRSWKKLLFRTYVIGNMSLDSFPKSASGDTPMKYFPNSAQPGIDYGAPIICLIHSPQDNPCHLNKVPGISIPEANIFDTITSTLRGQLLEIEKIRQGNCLAFTQGNTLTAAFWLYNTDPDLSTLVLPPGMASMAQIIRGMVAGLGIVPRELIHRYRIRTLNEYVNEAPKKAVNLDLANQLRNGRDPMQHERTLQAFFSAYFTLGNHTFPADSIVMDELIPNILLQLQDIKTNVTLYPISFEIDPNAATGDSASCNPTVMPVTTAGSGIPVGVFKVPNTFTYYAIRLKARAKVLFSPFGDMTMKAYAAAQPFGSRIGPPLPTDGSSFVYNSSTVGGSGFTPNLAMRAGEGNGSGQGYATQNVVSVTFLKMFGGGSGQGQTVSQLQAENAYHLAMAPNPFERGKYNIPVDGGLDSFLRRYDTSEILAFWAPAVKPERSQNLSQDLQRDVAELFGSIAGSALSLATPDQGLAKLQAQVTAGLNNYIGSDMTENRGENGESTNIFRMTNPINDLVTHTVMTNPLPAVFETSKDRLRTSWNRPNDEDQLRQGRDVYSVKLVSFQNLMSDKLKTNGASDWNNDIQSDAESEQDLPFLKH